MNEPWRSLRVGDRIRLVEMPSEFGNGEGLHRSTRLAYRRLIDRRRPLRVARIDEFGMPWVDFRLQRANGVWEYHSLLFNHGGWLRVQRRS